MTGETTRGLAHERAQKLLDQIGGAGAQYGVDARSKEFLASLIERKQRIASEKVDKWLRSLEHKVFVKGNAP